MPPKGRPVGWSVGSVPRTDGGKDEHFDDKGRFADEREFVEKTKNAMAQFAPLGSDEGNTSIRTACENLIADLVKQTGNRRDLGEQKRGIVSTQTGAQRTLDGCGAICVTCYSTA